MLKIIKIIEFDVNSLWKTKLYSYMFYFLHVFLMDVDFYDCVLHLLPLTDFELDKMGLIKRARERQSSQTCFEKTENQSLS